MKKYILIFTMIALLAGCDIDLKPESSLTYNGFWDTEEAARAAHVGIYASFRDYSYTFWSMGELRSDVWGGATIESPSGLTLIDNNLSTSSVPFNKWANFYKLTHYLNDFIKNAPNVTFEDESTKNQMLGEIYGIRAYVYYTMLRAWGDVPITTEPLLEVNLLKLKKPRSPKVEVMNQVKNDIAKSLEYFGANDGSWNGNIFWSKSATLALKGDAFLWSGQVLNGGNADFQEAKEALQNVSGFELVPYNELWGENNENNNEFIFAFDYQQDQASNFYGSFTARAVDIRSLYNSEGEPMSDFVVNGASRYGPSEKVLNMLDNQEDARRATFIRLFNNSDTHIPFDTNGYLGSVLTKFLGIIDNGDGSRKNNNNVPLYRYADVLLMLAEAKNNLGEDPSAEINEVRKRAYGDNFATYQYTNGTQAENTNAILNERLKEFVGEGKRWWDLVRAGGSYVFDEVATLDASEAYKIYYPITQSMIANDPELKQTEGY